MPRVRSTTTEALDAFRLQAMTTQNEFRTGSRRGAERTALLDQPDILAEYLYLSASLDNGVWRAKKDGLRIENFTACPDLYAFFDHYAKESGGKTPPLNLVYAEHPGMVYIEHVDREWTADRMRHFAGMKMLSKSLRKTKDFLDEDDLAGAIAYIRDATRDIGGRRSNGKGFADILDEAEAERLPGLYPAIEEAGGICRGYYVVVAGRPGDGKSWRLMQHAASMVQAGASVSFFSLEMTFEAVMKRLQMIVLGKRRLGMSFHEKRMAMVEWEKRSGGSFQVFDPSSGCRSSYDVVRNTPQGGVAVIDYIGLMSTGGGSRSIEDWRTAALISNELRIASLSEGITMVTGVQLNRSAASAPASSVPTLGLLSQTDAIGQDADIAIILRKPAQGLTKNFVVKARNGTTGQKWFTRFDPQGAGFGVVDAEDALTMINESQGEGL